VLISTGTKTLQDPDLSQDLATVPRRSAHASTAALLKGGRIICVYIDGRHESEGRLPSRQDATHLRTIVRFAAQHQVRRSRRTGPSAETETIWPL